ncbi:NUDIX hydrolase [Ktedonobacter sp. SOSP1-52]|uniref:8-oxo-dGTP diphosphatase MutT n=1 Tax=Ktedonobacter sp. SOSP1-52 TaxID=2778366 RepID=UPI0019163437|nr:8-oxo-dGTP diphosphatase MutT [Ktedonobacter sp. SOSP1-52]GHO65732.1 NUDIX hydrolase [Ktedonobacter sp. SOSP1-52]
MKVVTAAILNLNGKILIAKRKKGDTLENKWEFPGGKIEPGESPEQCLAREMLEEFGVTVQVQDFVCSSTYRYQHIEIELLAYNVRYIDGQFSLHDHQEIQWVTPSDLQAYDFAAADVPIVHKLLATKTQQFF